MQIPLAWFFAQLFTSLHVNVHILKYFLNNQSSASELTCIAMYLNHKTRLIVDLLTVPSTASGSPALDDGNFNGKHVQSDNFISIITPDFRDEPPWKASLSAGCL